MTRVAYNDDADNWDIIRAGGAAKKAIYGKRGQAVLREIKAALEALPEKRLAAHEFFTPDGEVCPLGALAKYRGMDLTPLVTDEDTDLPLDYDPARFISDYLGVTYTLAWEVMAENDEWGHDSPERRYMLMMQWINRNLQ